MGLLPVGERTLLRSLNDDALAGILAILAGAGLHAAVLLIQQILGGFFHLLRINHTRRLILHVARKLIVGRGLGLTRSWLLHPRTPGIESQSRLLERSKRNKSFMILQS